MSNADEAMSPAEFAKLMGAYPQPAENPLPAYGGYMDNSAANFAWVNNNDYFGAETFEEDWEDYPWGWGRCWVCAKAKRRGVVVKSKDSKMDKTIDHNIADYSKCTTCGATKRESDKLRPTPISMSDLSWSVGAETFEATPKWECDACGDMHDDEDEAESCCVIDCDHSDSEMTSWGGAYRNSEFWMYCNGCHATGSGTFNTITWEHEDGKQLEHEQTAESFNAEGTGRPYWIKKVRFQGNSEIAHEKGGNPFYPY